MSAADNEKKLVLMSQAAAGLELRGKVISRNADPDALVASLDSVASLRRMMEGCKGLQAREPLASALEHIILFVAEACAQGFPEPIEDSDAAWQLVAASISCGFELVEMCSGEETLSSEIWSTPLHILAATLDALKAQLWLLAANI